MKRVIWAAAAALSLLAGCSTPRPDPTPLAAYTPAIAGSPVWQAKLEGIDFPLQIAARPDAFVAAGRDGTVLALEPGSGRELWRAQAGATLSAGVGSDGRFASVVTRDNEVVVFEGGAERWRKRLPAGVLTAPLVAGERVFVLRVDRAVMAFDALDGRPLWTYQRPGEPLTLGQAGAIAPFGNLLLVGQGPRLVALDPLRGTLRWESAVATPRGTNEVERLADLVGPALRIGDTVCARAFQAAAGCVDARRGVLLWSRPSAGATALGGDAELLLGTDATGRLTAWRTPTGEVAWSQDLLLYREPTAPLLAGAVVVVGDLEGQVHFLSRQDGATQLRLPTDGTPVVGAPVLSGTTLLVATRGGGLFAFRPQ
ncbi:outer membrane protein assembly factor BamB [Rubrivivax albus]|uniref:Outer membrane protein assembly factor BamB n=1 Tax=Rubrivivax albus TaxID=2499835 RepID=A0A437K1D2_9BURK|nr:outer membrane protein assembly factor BamB [Rubrivivax albus]RVT54176.1 outer membrane protein assembly factor BamB [Rubrivivax albus]